jgi:protein-S-isoprenylcysteine O-methyltransferase Ste14
MRSFYDVGVSSRGMALRAVAVFLAGTLVGSVLPESGTVLASHLGIFSHIFNPLFLALGIIGAGLALFLRHRKRI